MKKSIPLFGIVLLVVLVSFFWDLTSDRKAGGQRIARRTSGPTPAAVRKRQRQASNKKAENNTLTREFFATYLRPTTISNCELERLGKENDGGYLSCRFDISQPAVAFSYGIAGRDSWGCDVAKEYGIPVFQYDPFNTSIPQCNNQQPLTKFHAIGIAEKTFTDTENRRFETFRDSLVSNNITGNVVVKMDIEGSEWLILNQLLDDGSYKRISQLVLETHDLLTNDENDAVLKRTVLKKLHEKFYIVHLHTNNNACTLRRKKLPAEVIEITYVNRNIPNLKSRPETAVWFPHELDSPNNPDTDDCPMDQQLFISEATWL